jgi:succinate dehydrogenase / fumarate reductase iron-sulfur subunit
MKKSLHILRRENAKSSPYWEDFLYETQEENDTVATALRAIAGAAQKEGDQRPVAWESSCLQKRCGACAMVINGKPALACDTFLKEIPGEKITLEPLRKFPVVEDLVVDRSIMMENLKALSVWLNEDAQLHSEEMAFEASVCLQCGLCLEVCPNFAPGGSFGGMAAMNPLAHLIANSPREGRKAVAKSYRRGVFNGCGKSLACRNICPAGIRIERLLVKSNAAAVWGRWRQIGKGSR